MTDIDRDSLPLYAGAPALMLMNGVFYKHCFPVPDTIIPVFVGFTASPAAVAASADYLRAFAPIGCRDAATAQLLRSRGIEAFITGCVTLAMQRRIAGEAAERRLFVVGGEAAGRLPPQVLAHIPSDLLAPATFVHHRQPVFEHPLKPATMRNMERLEQAIIDRYASEASLVLTPLHHVATPCMALGIPVVLCRERPDGRFSYLESMLPIHYPETLDAIDWAPAPFDNSGFRARMLVDVREGIERSLEVARRLGRPTP
ncbi:MAG: hypothetical protein KF914_16890 [Rhizobiaceae bacterium]|nr:hypothetical protein [Rhizobiaceae bacterium]